MAAESGRRSTNRALGISLAALAVSTIALVPTAFEFLQVEPPWSRARELSLARDYFRELASSQGDRLAIARYTALSGSAAEAFLVSRRYQLDTLEIQDPDAAEPYTVEWSGDQVELCKVGAPDDCSVITDIIVDEATGRLVDFSLDGRPVSTWVVNDGTWSTEGNTSARLLSARETPTGGLRLFLQIATTADPFELDIGSTAYLGPDGKYQYPSTDSTIRVEPYSNRYVYVYVSQTAGFGGLLGLATAADDQRDTEYLWVNVPSP